ncbi:MAG TPA: C69 family dipeptidase [Levilinea sp.]|nr:C69 family dipeptidase [Levilinea sp.]
MCDTMVALGHVTADGTVLFAKNSDREPNEAQYMLLVPAADHPPGSQVKCTYIEIPQIAHTYSVLLSKPFWMWGAEMGANEHGVVIGNEAVFSKVPAGKELGLIGMDYLRLALERGNSARQALQVIVDLLAQYGQSGNCGFTHPLYYHNSFIIADPQEAWVLETVDRQWAAEKVRDIRSISNGLTIGRMWDLASDGLIDYAVERGLCKNRADFDFRNCYSDLIYTRFSDSANRQACSTQFLGKYKGQVSTCTMMAALRSHSQSPGAGWSPDKGLLGADVCMHAGYGPVRGSQSVASFVSEITPKWATHWFTGTSAPCTGIFIPVWMDAGLPDMGPLPAGEYDERSLFWRHERLHRAVLKRYSMRLSTYASERDQLQALFIEREKAARSEVVEVRRKFSQVCLDEAEVARRDWLVNINAIPQPSATFYGRLAWKKFDRDAKMPE